MRVSRWKGTAGDVKTSNPATSDSADQQQVPVGHACRSGRCMRPGSAPVVSFRRMNRRSDAERLGASHAVGLPLRSLGGMPRDDMRAVQHVSRNPALWPLVRAHVQSRETRVRVFVLRSSLSARLFPCVYAINALILSNQNGLRSRTDGGTRDARSRSRGTLKRGPRSAHPAHRRERPERPVGTRGAATGVFTSVCRVCTDLGRAMGRHRTPPSASSVRCRKSLRHFAACSLPPSATNRAHNGRRHSDQYERMGVEDVRSYGPPECPLPRPLPQPLRASDVPG